MLGSTLTRSPLFLLALIILALAAVYTATPGGNFFAPDWGFDEGLGGPGFMEPEEPTLGDEPIIEPPVEPEPLFDGPITAMPGAKNPNVETSAGVLALSGADPNSVAALFFSGSPATGQPISFLLAAKGPKPAGEDQFRALVSGFQA